MAVLVT
jgi:hypothetical protein